MKNDTVSYRGQDRRLQQAFISRCYDEGVDPVEVLEAWVRRAVRQDRTVMPISLDVERPKVQRIR